MVVYRLAEKEYADDLSGYGAFLYGGRWNEKGHSMLYCATSVSLATLEVLVRLQHLKIQKKFQLIVISIPENADFNTLKKNNLSNIWIQDIYETQKCGTDWLKNNTSLYLEVPSAIVPIDKNILINPLHHLFSKVEIVDQVEYNFDNRLFKSHTF